MNNAPDPADVAHELTWEARKLDADISTFKEIAVIKEETNAVDSVVPA